MSRAMFLLVIGGLLCGCGKDSEESFAKRSGSKIGTAVTEFASGLGSGVDEQLLVDVELSGALAKQGFSKTVSKSLGIDLAGKGISVYLLSANAYQGRLMAKAFNKADQEIGRSVVEVEFAADDAQYVQFIFDDQVDMQLATRFLIEARQPPPNEDSAAEPPAPAK